MPTNTISGKEGAYLQGEAKSRYVRSLFARLAASYDRINTVASVGQDERWRRLAVDLAAPASGERALDVACGTGRLSLTLARRSPAATRVVGVDLSPPMLALARGRTVGEGIALACADAQNLPFADASFDLVTCGFGLRNMVDVPRFLAEAHRVLRPGGRLTTLEIIHPPANLVSLPYRLYFRYLVPLIGGLISGHWQDYSYLPHSAEPFPDAAVLAARLSAAGFEAVTWRSLAFGGVAIHRATKPAGRQPVDGEVI